MYPLTPIDEMHGFWPDEEEQVLLSEEIEGIDRYHERVQSKGEAYAKLYDRLLPPTVQYVWLKDNLLTYTKGEKLTRETLQKALRDLAKSKNL